MREESGGGEGEARMGGSGRGEGREGNRSGDGASYEQVDSSTMSRKVKNGALLSGRDEVYQDSPK